MKKVLEDMKGKTQTFVQDVQNEMNNFSAALKVYALQEVDRIANIGEDAD